MREDGVFGDMVVVEEVGERERLGVEEPHGSRRL